jgi:hypothetical protein
MKRQGRRPALAALDREARTATASSADGVVVYRLAACAGGVHVERAQVRAHAGRALQSMWFEDDASFVRWCEADRLKYTYPLLYANLKRSGCALFSPPR